MQDRRVFGLHVREVGMTIDWTIPNFSRCALYSKSTKLVADDSVSTSAPNVRGVTLYRYKWGLNFSGDLEGRKDKGEVLFCLQGERREQRNYTPEYNGIIPLRWKFR